MVKKVLMLLLYFAFLFPLQGCSGSNIEIVQNGTLDIDKSINIIQAFEGNQFHQDSAWNNFEDAQERIIVEYKTKLNTQILLNNESLVRSVYQQLYGHAMSKEKLVALIEKNSSSVQIPYFLLVQFTLHKNKDDFDISHIGLYTNGEEVSKISPIDFVNNLQTIYTNKLVFEWFILASLIGDEKKQ